MKTASTPASDATVLPLQLAARHHEIVNNLALIGHGELLDVLADERLDLEKAISDVGKAGELTIKIKIAPNGTNQRVITFDVKSKRPVAAGRSTFVFATQSGQYVENNPDQKELPLRNVTSIEEGKQNLRAVGE